MAEQEIPSVDFDQSKNLGIEVMNVEELLKRLHNSKDHDPFSVHRLEFFMILLITQGSYEHSVDFKTYNLREGSTLFVAKNQVHSFTETIASCEGYCIVFQSLTRIKDYYLSNALKLDRLFNYHLESPVIHQDEMGSDNLIEIIKTIHYEFHFDDDFGKPEILNILIRALLLKAERATKTQTIEDSNMQWLEIFNQFKSLVETQYRTTRSSRVYASELLISYKHLNQIVKAFTGKTAKVFINDFVVVELKRHLVSTTLTVKEISYKTGFEEPSNLVKFFKKNTNTTPSQFRKQH